MSIIRRIQDGYIHTNGVILLVTALVKLASALSTAPVLDWLDSLLQFSNRHLFVLSGMLELGLSAFLFLGCEGRAKIFFIAWQADIYLVYRVGLWWAGTPNLCNCLGNLTDKFPVAPGIIDQIGWILLGWLFVGSHVLGMFEWLGNQTARIHPNNESKMDRPIHILYEQNNNNLGINGSSWLE
jgi:hypothetical protein